MQNTSKNLDSQMFINCSFDIDYLEVTKIEPLKRYEENLYLLGKIFSSNENSKISDKKDDSKMDVDTEIINHSNNNSSIENQINNIVSSKDKQLKREEIQDVISSLKNESLSDMERLIIEQIISSVDEYEQTEKIIKDNKDLLNKKKQHFNGFVSKIKNSKMTEDEVETIEKDLADYGYLTELNKLQLNDFKSNDSANCKKRIDIKPDNETNNIVLTQL